jgi:hypothetical protein
VPRKWAVIQENAYFSDVPKTFKEIAGRDDSMRGGFSENPR